MKPAQPWHPSLTAAQIEMLSALHARCIHLENTITEIQVYGPAGQIPDVGCSAGHLLELFLARFQNQLEDLGASGVFDPAQVKISRALLRIAERGA